MMRTKQSTTKGLKLSLLGFKRPMPQSMGRNASSRKRPFKSLGQLVGKEGIHADSGKVSAVKHMAEPTDIHKLRRFLGMVNQSGKNIRNLAEFTHSLREPLSKKNA